MALPVLLGPIDLGSSFMFVSLQNGKPFVLNGSPFNNGIIYYWEPDFTTALNNPYLPVFTSSGSLSSLSLFDTTNKGAVSFRSDGLTLGNSSSPSTITMSQNTYTNWNSPHIFLSMAIYTIYNSSGTISQIQTNNSGSGPTIPANNLLVLPIIWYNGCSDNTYSYINTVADSLTNWFCIILGNSSHNCLGISLLNNSWTNISDCRDGNLYSYCLSDNLCGTGSPSCKGPCSKNYDDCVLSSDYYSCVFNPTEYISNTNWWESPYFIGLIVGSFILLIVIIVVIIIVIKKK